MQGSTNWSELSFRCVITSVLGLLFLVLSVLGIGTPEAGATVLTLPNVAGAAPQNPRFLGGESAAGEQSAADPAVQVVTEKRRYRCGELILVRLVNFRTEGIYAPPARLGTCSNLEVQKLTVGKWIGQGYCKPGAENMAISLGPKSLLSAALLRDSKPVNGPYVSDPVAPGVLSDARFPPIEPSRLSELTVEVPEGNVNAFGLLHDVQGLAFGPGAYRLVYRFTMVSTKTVQEVVSEVFDIESPC